MNNADKIYSAIMGLVVGDALGVPYEFRKRDTFRAEGMVGFGTHMQPPGTWSDDSSMTLATMSSIHALERICPADIMTSFAQWLLAGAYTPYGEVFDVGNATHKAIARYLIGTPADECGCTGEHENGNGALMRILPLAFLPHSINDIHDVAGLTHAHDISKNACEIYLAVAAGLIAGDKKRTAILEATTEFCICEEFERLTHLDKLERDEIRSSGYVVDTLEAALWCLLKTDNYRDCVLTAVNLGDDTDTVAAVAGGLAGILYGVGGEKGIPEDWIEQIARHDKIKELCEAFADATEKREASCQGTEEE